ncbi:MAG: hypothetical protein V4592_18975 [Bacteroidota bacterium]
MRKNFIALSGILMLSVATGCKKSSPNTVSIGTPVTTTPVTTPVTTTSLNITIAGSKFNTGGKEIFFNGINSAWQKQSDYSLDFLGKNYDATAWNTEFQKYVDNHINLARIWIHGRGNSSPSLNADGITTGASDQFWADMDNLVKIATAKKVYIIPTFWSFGMVINDATVTNYTKYRDMINDVTKLQSYINNFLVPFVKRYANEPYVMGYDICNEPEHMWRDANCGPLNHDNVVRFVAYTAAAIHQNTTKPVTVGSMWIIYDSNRFGSGWAAYAGNNYSNAALQAQYNNSAAYLDFYSPHWYQWQTSDSPVSKTVANWLDNADKPVLIEETYGGDVTAATQGNAANYNITMADFYKTSYTNGYAGVCGWKNPWENDGYGTFNGIATGTNAFYALYPKLVYPQ